VDINEAYERLGLGETTPQEELDHRFDLLLKREKTARTSGSGDVLSEIEQDIDAYRVILDYRAKRIVELAEEERLGKFGKLSGTVGRSEDFLRINRTKIIVVIAALAVLIGIGSYVGHIIEQRRYEASLPPVDLNIMFLGTFQANDQDQESELVQQAILKAFPDWKRVKVRILYLPPPGKDTSGMGAANLQKAMAELSVEYPDVLVLDKDSLDWMSGQDSMADLRDPAFAKIYAAAMKKNAIVNAVNKQTGIEHAYGFDFTRTEFAKSMPMQHGDMIAAAKPGGNNNKKIMEFLEKCAEVSP